MSTASSISLMKQTQRWSPIPCGSRYIALPVTERAAFTAFMHLHLFLKEGERGCMNPRRAVQ